jgi:hypothetical protein
MRTTRPVLDIFTVLLLAASVTLAETVPAPVTAPGRDGWTIRFYVSSIDFDATNGHRGHPYYNQDLDVGFGLGLNAEYRFSRRFGIDLGILGGAAVDVAWNTGDGGNWSWTARDTLTFTPLTAGIDIHLIPDNSVDLAVCPMLTWTHYGGIIVYAEPNWTSTEIHFQEDLGLAVALRLAVPLGERTHWSFTADLTYFESDLDSDIWLGDRLAHDYDVTVFGLGFGYRF